MPTLLKFDTVTGMLKVKPLQTVLLPKVVMDPVTGGKAAAEGSIYKELPSGNPISPMKMSTMSIPNLFVCKNVFIFLFFVLFFNS